jgi:hypothetical protein
MPRSPSPTNPTRTTSIGGVRSPNTGFWPSGRCGSVVLMMFGMVVYFLFAKIHIKI